MNNSIAPKAISKRKDRSARHWLWSWILLLLTGLPICARAQFNYTINNGAVTITGYTGPGGPVSIPSTLAGLPVVGIGNNALSYCSTVTSITIANTVTNIGSDAFYWCTGLTNVALGRAVYSIGYGAFDGCSQLAAITVDRFNTTYASQDGVLLNKTLTTLLQCPEGKLGSYALPGSVTTIAGGAFYFCSGLTNVSMGGNVTDIGADAFMLCGGLESITLGSGIVNIGSEAFRRSGLTRVTIPANVVSIGLFAFAGCDSLASIIVDASNPFYSSSDGVLFDKNQTTLLQWPGGKASSYTIPSGVTSIGAGAFYYCSTLTSITIANDVGEIGPYAFELCGSLTNVVIGSRVTTIGDSAFYYCNLIGVHFLGNPPMLGAGVFDNDFYATIYYLPGTTGWGSMFGGRPTALWELPNPVILTIGPGFGVQTNMFGFVISWAAHPYVIVEASTNIANPTWLTLATNSLTGGSSYFSDADWINHPARFYRVHSP